MNKFLGFAIFVFILNYNTYGQANFSVGTFTRSGLNSETGWITTYPESDSTVLLYIELTRGAPSYNSGSMYTRINLTSSPIIFRSIDIDLKCEIELVLKNGSVILTTLNDDCGFGHGVFADGLFKKKSSIIPEYFVNREGMKISFTETPPEKYGQ
jgi:hypothetical protein